MSEQVVELLFFDTFAHDNTEELNLDLVQFPKPVYVTEVRIIPLGARVQADFPGGVRLGATNPSQFQIEFFVNDLGKPGASTFETLGGFQYDQNGCINLESCVEESVRKIPTDGLVLRGWYTTITLAVYGTLTNNITEQIVPPVVNPALPTQPNTIADVQQISSVEPEWQPEPVPSKLAPLDYNAQQPANYQAYTQPEPFPQEYPEYYPGDIPKDPRSYHHTPETDWDAKSRPRDSRDDRDRERERDRDRDRERDRDRSRDIAYQKTNSLDRDHSDRDRRDRERRSSRSETRDIDRSHEYAEVGRDRNREHDRDRERDWDRERDHRDRDWDRERDHRGERDHAEWNEVDRDRHDRDRRDRERRHEDYRRYHNEREDRKRPRTPPTQSPKRPHTPHKEPSPAETQPAVEEKRKETIEKEKTPPKETKETKTSPLPEEPPAATPSTAAAQQMDVEEFEPILSDEDILDDNDHYQELEFDYTTYTNNDDIIKLFVPGVTQLAKCPRAARFALGESGLQVAEDLRNAIGIADDYLKSSITKYTLESFERHNTEIKEEFIHLCEKLIGVVGPAKVFCDIATLYALTKSLNTQSLPDTDKEMTNQIHFTVETIFDWLKIALNYEMANVQDQPAYKIRHIKCGVRLAEWVNSSEDFVKILWQMNFNMHKELLNLCDQEFMALSIKLMILKALDTYLLHRFAIEKFLMGGTGESPKENGYCDVIPVAETNGYRLLVQILQKNPLVRLKFALNSILKKLNLYEMLYKVHGVVAKLRIASYVMSPEEVNILTKSLNQILNYCQAGSFVLSQPKRFLPVSAQFEIPKGEERDVIIEYLKMFNVMQCFLLLVTYPGTLNLPAVRTYVLEVVATLLDSFEGLRYLSENISTVNVLLKCLVKTEEEIQYNPECVEFKSHALGLKLAYKLQALYHVEVLLDIAKKYNFDTDSSDILDQLHGLFCLSFSNVGRIAAAEVLASGDNIKSILQFFENVNTKDKSESYLTKLKKSPGVAYIVDLIYLAVVTVPSVELLEKRGKSILHICNMLYDDSLSTKLNDLRAFLSPLELVNTLSYDNIAPFVETIEKNIENLIYSPGPTITSLRIIEHLGISKNNNKSPIINENPLYNYVELKYKHVVLQLFSLDGVSILSKLLQRICNYYEQPNLHSSVFAANQGLQIANIIRPAVILLKQMLGYVIQCRNTKFKDLSTVPVFLRCYTLLNSFPVSSPGYAKAQETKVCIVEALLVYTQPVSEEVHEKDSLNKTLWTQMCGEVVRYISSAPYTFIPGLLLFSELLPLPLPVQARGRLSAAEISWAVNLRRLWSAHLHPHSAAIQDTVARLCVSTQPQLLNLLRRICVQLADLAANSALTIARGILDGVHAALATDGGEGGPCGGHAARLLNFLACLVTHGTIKCAVLHLIHSNGTVTGKADERYAALVQTFVRVLKVNDSTTSHVQAEECILSIIQSFCDSEIILIQNSAEISPLVYLANSMPIKEHLLVFINIMLDHLSSENSFLTYLPIVRTLLLLTEYDYTFYHLRENILKRNHIFSVLLNKLAASFSKNNPEYLSTLNTLVEFLRVCAAVEETDSSTVPTRRMTMSLEEVRMFVDWPVAEKGEGGKKHPLLVLEGTLKKETEEDSGFESMLEAVTGVLKMLREPVDVKREPFAEIVLPAPETLMAQFSLRTMFTSSGACNERLTDRYWLAMPTEEGDGELDTVTCDIFEVCKQNLSQEYNIIKEVEKLCRISRTESADDKDKRDDDDKDKMKKPFAATPARARGFARAATPQRSDPFRSRPPNTSRPPSLHVDDFVVLETCGAQPTGPTGYNRISRELLASTRVARGTRGRAFVASERSVHYGQMSWWGAAFGRGPYL